MCRHKLAWREGTVHESGVFCRWKAISDKLSDLFCNYLVKCIYVEQA